VNTVGRAAQVRRRVVLAVVLLSAAALRLYGLRVQSLWHDELFSWYASHLGSIRQAVHFGAVEDVHPPGFILLMYGAQRLLGDGEAMLRLPAALAGVLSVAWIYRLGARLLSPRDGLTASALCAVAWMPVYYSQEERPYIWLFLGAIALAERLLSLIQRSSADGRAAVGQGAQVLLIAIGLSYLHYFGLLLSVLALLAWGAWAAAHRIGRALWLSVAGLFLIAYAPWIAVLSTHVLRGKSWIPAPTPARVGAIYIRMVNQHAALTGAVWLAGAVSAFSLARRSGSTARAWLRRGLAGPTGMLVAWATLPALTAVAVSLLVLPVATDRNLIIVLPAILLITAQAAGSIERRFGRGPWVTALLTVGLLVDLIVVRDYYARPTKWQYRETAATIIAQRVPALTPPFVVSGAWHPSYFDYYFTHRGSPIRVSASAIGAGAIQRIVDSARPADPWVTSPASPVSPASEPLRLVGYEQIGAWQFVGWTLYHFRAVPGQPPAREHLHD